MTARLVLKAAIVTLWLLLLVAYSVSAQTFTVERGWQLLVDKKGTFKLADLDAAEGWRNVRAGLSWNAQFADMRDYMGAAWYRTNLDVPQLKDGQRALVRFGAVDYFSEVYVNGKQIGAHEGGYTPFEFDITDAVKPGVNKLVVRVVDPPMEENENRALFPEMMYNEIPHGKQNWYVQTGGIWQDVVLEIRPKVYIKDVRVIPKIDGSLRVNVSLSGRLNFLPSAKLQVRVLEPSGDFLPLKQSLDFNGSSFAFDGKVNDPRLWSVDHPTLYTIEVTYGDDRYTDRFGFRSFEARNGKFYLNGQPFYMIGALDQDFYPEGIYTPPSEEFVRDEMLKGKRIGLNTLRCHIKVPDPMYLKVADEVGMLVWYEIPSWNDFNHFTSKAAARGEQTFSEQVARDWNHPSIVIQSIINESWGADLKESDQRRWLLAAYERAKKLTAPLNRLIVDNSACCDNFHIKTDIADFHQYFSIPDHHQNWDKWVADYAARPPWTFSAHGDAERTGGEPLVVSEFGNWGLPKLPRDLPWWFGRDFGGRPVTRPAGVRARFKQYKFDALFTDFNELAEETQHHQFISLKHEIEEIRRHDSIQGYVITEFTDINWEANGLMDMYRNPKVYAADLAKIQQPDVVLARLPKANYTSGEKVSIETLLSHYSDKDLRGAYVRWKLESGASGHFNIERSIESARVEPLQKISFISPTVDRTRREHLQIEIRARDNSLIAENSYEIFVYPKSASFPTGKVDIVVYDPIGQSARLAPKLMTAGYKVFSIRSAEDVANNRASGALLIATKFDDSIARRLRSGGRAIILANDKEALPAMAPYKIAARAGSDLDGNWVTNFNWVRTNVAPFRSVAFTRVLGFESARVVPQYIIQGVRGEDYADVLSGIFYGWLNNNAALALQMNVGGGKALITTFRFDEYGDDPYATHLLNELIKYVSEPTFKPHLNMRTEQGAVRIKTAQRRSRAQV